MIQNKLNDLNIQNKEERMKCNGKLLHPDNGLKYNTLKNSIFSYYLFKKFNEENCVLVKSANNTISEQIQKIINQVFSPRELIVHCITVDK